MLNHVHHYSVTQITDIVLLVHEYSDMLALGDSQIEHKHDFQVVRVILWNVTVVQAKAIHLFSLMLGSRTTIIVSIHLIVMILVLEVASSMVSAIVAFIISVAIGSTTSIVITVRILHAAVFLVMLVLPAMMLVLLTFVVHLIFWIVEISRKVHVRGRKVVATVVVLFASTIIATLVATTLPVSIVLLTYCTCIWITIVLFGMLTHIVGRSLIRHILRVILSNLASVRTTVILILLVVVCCACSVSHHLVHWCYFIATAISMLNWREIPLGTHVVIQVERLLVLSIGTCWRAILGRIVLRRFGWSHRVSLEVLSATILLGLELLGHRCLLLTDHLILSSLIVTSNVLLLLLSLLWLIVVLLILLLLLLVQISPTIVATNNLRIMWRGHRRESRLVLRWTTCICGVMHLAFVNRLPLLMRNPVTLIVMIVAMLLILVAAPMFLVSSLNLVHLVILATVATFSSNALSISTLTGILRHIVILLRHF